MIKNFLIINCTGKNNIIALRVNNNFFFKKFQINLKKNEPLVNKISDFVKQRKAIIDKNFSVIVNIGPGSFSELEFLAVAKGIKITKDQNYGYKDHDLGELTLKILKIN